MASEFPKTFYRFNEAGEQEGKTFKSAAEVEDGWLTWEQFSALPRPKAKSSPKLDGSVAVDAEKRIVTAEADNARLKDTLKLREDEATIKDSRIAALEAQIEAQRAFLAQLRGDDNCPDALKEAIGELFSDGADTNPSPTKAAKVGKKKSA